MKLLFFFRQLSKLRVALDCETSYQHNNKLKSQQISSDSKATCTLPVDDQSEERLQILSVIMLHLCSGLQNTQSNI
jgi:PDZ domain-containing protein 8